MFQREEVHGNARIRPTRCAKATFGIIIVLLLSYFITIYTGTPYADEGQGYEFRNNITVSEEPIRETNPRDQSGRTNQMDPRDWRPKWSTIPSNELDSHFTDYEISSMKAMKALLELPSFNRSNIDQALQDNPCDLSFIHNGQRPWSFQFSKRMLCCLGTANGHNENEVELGYDLCYEGKYDIRMDVFQQHQSLTSHDLFRILPNDSKMLMIGDSVSMQLQDGFFCDVIRNNHRGDDTPIEFQTANASRSKAEAATFTAMQDDGIKMVHLDLWVDPTPELEKYTNLCESHNVVVFHWGHWLHHPNTKWVDGIFRILQDCFDQYESLENKPVFIWLEATAQHFDGRIGGFYEDIYQNMTLSDEWRQHISRLKQDPELLTDDAKWDASPSRVSSWHGKRHCGPQQYFRDETFERHIKRQAVIDGVRANPDLTFNLEMVYPDREIEGQRDNTLYFIPLKDVTDPLWHLHLGGGPRIRGPQPRLKVGADCTHWCYTPFMWEFVWDSMTKIVENQN